MTQVIITSGTTWTVPADWNSSNNSIEGVGGGSAGGDGGSGAGNVGGGGGAYSKAVNQSYTASGSITIQVGAGGASNLNSGTDTFVKNNANSANAVLAKGGNFSSGGSSGSGVGSTKTSGGSGGGDGVPGNPGGGGGGAGGEAGNGQAGAQVGGAGNANTSGGGAGGTAGSGNGGAGGNGTNFGSPYGSGGGGGGGGTSGTTTGGAAGLYGGGGGGGYEFGAGGAGAAGIIVITYTPASSVAFAEVPPRIISRAEAIRRATVLAAAHLVGIEAVFVPPAAVRLGFEVQPPIVRKKRGTVPVPDAASGVFRDRSRSAFDAQPPMVRRRARGPGSGADDQGIVLAASPPAPPVLRDNAPPLRPVRPGTRAPWDDGGALSVLGAVPAPGLWVNDAAAATIPRKTTARLLPIESWPLDAIVAPVAGAQWLADQPQRVIARPVARILPAESWPLDAIVVVAEPVVWAPDAPPLRVRVRGSAPSAPDADGSDIPQPSIRWSGDLAPTLARVARSARIAGRESFPPLVVATPTVWTGDQAPMSSRRRALPGSGGADVFAGGAVWGFEAQPLKVTWRRSLPQSIETGKLDPTAAVVVPLLWGFEAQPRRPRITWRTPWVANADPATVLGEVPSPAANEPVTSAGQFFGVPAEVRRHRKPEPETPPAPPRRTGPPRSYAAYAAAAAEARAAEQAAAAAAADLAAAQQAAAAQAQQRAAELRLAELAADDEDVLLLSS